MMNKTDPARIEFMILGETDINQVITQMSLQALLSAQKKYEVVSEDNIGDFESWESDSFLRDQQQCRALRTRGHCLGENCSRWCQGIACLKALRWEMRGVSQQLGEGLRGEHVSGMEGLPGRATLASLLSSQYRAGP